MRHSKGIFDTQLLKRRVMRLPYTSPTTKAVEFNPYRTQSDLVE